MKKLLLYILICVALAGWPADFAYIWHMGYETGMPQSLVVDAVQDEEGYMWFATRDGLARYNGRLAETFRNMATYDSLGASRRIDRVGLDSSGNIVFSVKGKSYRFDKDRQQSVPVDKIKFPPFYKASDSIATELRRLDEFRDTDFRVLYRDRQDRFWVSSQRGVDRVLFAIEPPCPIPTGANPNEILRSIAVVGTDTLAANKFGQIMKVSGGKGTEWLSADGIWQTTPVNFGADAYVIVGADNQIWIGTKQKGLFRLDSGDLIHVDLPDGKSVYALTFDKRGRLYVGNYDGGLSVIDCPTDSMPQVKIIPGIYKIRSIDITDDNILLAATDSGLYTLNLDNPDRVYRSEIPGGNNVVMDICRIPTAGYFIATYGGGVARLEGDDFCMDDIPMTVFSAKANGLASDVCRSMIALNDSAALIIGEHSLTIYNVSDNTFSAIHKGFGGGEFSFSEGKPIVSADGKVLVGTSCGLLCFGWQQSPHDMGKLPKIVLSCSDTVNLSPDERGFSLSFSTLDFNRIENIKYAYRIEGLESEWTITTDNNLHFANLPPGQFNLILRSTDGLGRWLDNERTVTINRAARFTETKWFWILTGSVIILLVYGTYKVFRVIRTLRNEISQMSVEKAELLEYYNVRFRDFITPQKLRKTDEGSEQTENESEGFRTRVDELLWRNYSNPELDVDFLAKELAMSRTKLYREIKSVFGKTPNTLIQDFRLDRAEEKLREGKTNITAVAFDCGWNSPKYFSRVFKNSRGYSPSELTELP